MNGTLDTTGTDTMPDDTPPALAAALDYLARGWSVLPLCPHDHVGVGKAHRGCGSPGKRPFFPDRPDGSQGEWKEFQTRLPTAEEVNRWWHVHPKLNVGVALGALTGVAAIDVDDEDGEVLLRELAGGDLPETWEYSTGKGRRLLYRLPEGVHVRSVPFKRAGTEIEILRLMGTGGQVVLPPSVHPNGSVYRWRAGHSPADMPAADCPAWMRATAVPESSAPAPADGELIQEGGRDNYLTAVAGAMRKRGCHEEAIRAALDVMNRDRCDPPLTDRDVNRIARSVSRYEPDAYTAVSIKAPEPGRIPAPVGEYDRRFKWASELAAPPKADDWIWRGYLPRGAITLLSALWKAGKTTLLAHLLRALASEGEFLGQPIRAARVLYVSEEGEQHWVRRRDDLSLGDHVGFYLQPFAAKPQSADWLGFVGQLKRDVETHGFDLIVFDTLAKLWPVKEENDAGEVDAALMPLWELTKAGAGVLLIHHLRKSGGAEYTGSRGSGALSAFPDIIVELTRFDAADHKSKKRMLRAKGRYEETPDELVIELVAGAYVHVPEPSNEVQADGTVTVPEPKDEEGRILSVLLNSPSAWVQVEEIRAMLKARGWGIRCDHLNTHLFSLYNRGEVVMRGVVRSKSNPREYAAAGHPGASHLSRSTPGGVSGNDMSDAVDSSVSENKDSSRSQPATQGRNETGRDEVESWQVWWAEVKEMIRTGGPLTPEEVSDAAGHDLGEVRRCLSYYAGIGAVTLDETGAYRFKEAS